MTHRIRKYCNGSVVFFILLFGAIWYNNTYNQHVHILSNGFIVVHSHPYLNNEGENSPFKSHQHSGFELFSIENLHLLLFSSVLLFVALSIARKVRYAEVLELFQALSYRLSFHERAPPCFAYAHMSKT